MDSDPNQELDDFYGLGAGRRKTLAAIKEKPTLSDVEDVEKLEDLVGAVEEINLPSYSNPPTETITTLTRIHDDLPPEARPHFVSDDKLRARINSARRYFTDTYLGRIKREKEIPSPVECGPANYPTTKKERTQKYAHEAKEKLQSKLERIRQCARGGARTRALAEIGLTVGEYNEQQRTQTREAMREQLEPDDLVHFRNPQERLGMVVRVNKKSVRVRYPNPRAGHTKPLSDEPEPDELETRVDLDSDFFWKITPTTVQDVDDYESVQELRDDLFSTEEA